MLSFNAFKHVKTKTLNYALKRKVLTRFNSLKILTRKNVLKYPFYFSRGDTGVAKSQRESRVVYEKAR